MVTKGKVSRWDYDVIIFEERGFPKAYRGFERPEATWDSFGVVITSTGYWMDTM
jgi:hypothetical protein